MSVQASAWVWAHSQACGNDRLVLLAIADACDATGGNAWPSVAYLAKACKVSPSTVQRCLRALAALGEIVVQKQAGGTANTRADRRPNRYRLPMRIPAHGVSDSHPEPPEAVDPQVTDPPPTPNSDGVSDRHPEPLDGVAEPCHPATGHGVSPQTSRGVTHDVTGCHSSDALSTQDPPLNHPTAAAASASSQQQTPEVQALRAALATAGLDASWRGATAAELADVTHLVQVHGTARLTRTAAARHRPDHPAGHARAWFADWLDLAIRAPSTATGPPRAAPPPHVDPEERARGRAAAHLIWNNRRSTLTT